MRPHPALRQALAPVQPIILAPALIGVAFFVLTLRALGSAAVTPGQAALFWGYLLVVCFGFGDATLVGARVRRTNDAVRAILTLATGYVVLSFANAVATLVLDPGVIFWLALAVSVAWLAGRLLLARGPLVRMRLEGLVTAGALSAIVTAVASAGSRLWAPSGESITSVQHLDVLFHVAVTKEGLLHGVPWQTTPVIAGAPWPSYHVAFDALSVTMARGLGIDPAGLVVGLAIPAAFAAVVLATAAVSGVWVRHHGGALATVGVVLVSLTAGALPSVWLLQGSYGAYLFAYFLYNPPAAVGAAAVMVGIALFAKGETDSTNPRPIIAAALLMAASTAMKAHIAIVFVPALALVLTIGLIARRVSFKTYASSIVAMGAVGLLSLYIVRGMGAPLGVRYGLFAQWLASQSDAGPVITQMTALAIRAPAIGPVLAVAVNVVAGVLGGRLAFALLTGTLSAGVRDRWRRIAGQRPGSVILVASAVIAAVIIGLTLVPLDTGRFEPWNIAGHSVYGLHWLGVAIAGSTLALLAGSTMPRRYTARTLTVVALLGLGLLAVTVRPVVGDMREVGRAEIPSDAFAVLQDIGKVTPEDAVVVQGFEYGVEAWVAGFGGRRSPLERGDTWIVLYPDYAVPRARLIDELYSARDTATARDRAQQLGADYAVVSTDDPAALWAIGDPVTSHGDWALIRLDTTATD